MSDTLDWCDIDSAIWTAVTTGTPYVNSNQEALHFELEQLGLCAKWAKAVVHQMIDSGWVRELKCEMPICVMPTRTFGISTGRRTWDGLSIDHVVQRRDGGSDRPENLRLAHLACNCADATRGRSVSTETRAKRSASLKGVPKTPEHKAKISAARRAREA